MKSFVQIFSEPGHGAIDGLESWPDPRIDAIHEWNVYKLWLRQFLIDASCEVPGANWEEFDKSLQVKHWDYRAIKVNHWFMMKLIEPGLKNLMKEKKSEYFTVIFYSDSLVRQFIYRKPNFR